MNTRYTGFLFALGLTLLAPSYACAQHAGDVQLQVENGKIVIGSAELDASNNTTSVTIGERVFSDSLLPNFRSSDPGFNSDGTGDPVLPPGVEGFPGNTELMFDIMPIEVGATTANFFYWDGLDQGTNGVGPEDVNFTLAAANVTWTLVDDDFNFFTADGSVSMVPGGLLGETSVSGRLHNHLIISVDDGDGNINTTADEGIYLASLQTRATGFTTSDPFLFAHRSPTISQAVLDVATDWIDQNYNALTGMGLPGDFNGDGLVDAADYTVWRDTGGPIEDYNTWVANYGAPPSSSSSASVPEPSTMSLLTLGMLSLRRIACRKVT